MLKALKFFFTHHKAALAGFALALAFMLYFGIRAGADFIYFNDPAHRDEALAPWMTPRYVSMSYRLPKEVVQEVFELNSMEGRRNTLADIAAKQGVPLAVLQERILYAQKRFEQNGNPQAPRP